MAKLSAEDNQQFREWIYAMVQQYYKKELLWKARLRWRLVRHWNGRWANVGIPGSVREILGEDGATQLFQEVSEDIISNPDLLWAVVNDDESTGSISGEQNMDNQHKDETFRDDSTTKAAQHTIYKISGLLGQIKGSNVESVKAAISYLIFSAELVSTDNEYGNWFKSEVDNIVAEPIDIFNTMALCNIHGNVIAAAKQENPDAPYPESNPDALRRMKDIYNRTLELRSPDNQL